MTFFEDTHNNCYVVVREGRFRCLFANGPQRVLRVVGVGRFRHQMGQRTTTSQKPHAKAVTQEGVFLPLEVLFGRISPHRPHIDPT